MLLLCALVVGSSSVWADEDDVHDLGITQNTGLNDNASIPSIEIDDPGYTVKQVQIGWKYNKAVDDIVTIEVTIDGTSLGTQTVGGKTSNTANFNASDLSGDIVISFTNHAGSGTGKGTFYVQSVKLVEGAPADLPYWVATYKYNDGVTADKVVNVTKGDDAAAYTLESAPSRVNFDFLGWNDGTNNYDGGAAYALTSNKTFTAQWEYSGPCTKFNKSSKSDLATGAQYIMVGDKSGTNYFALNDIASGHLYFGSSAVSNENSSISDTKAVIVDETPLVLTLEETSDGWYLKRSSDGKKLGLTGDKQMNWDSGDQTWVLGGSDDTPTFTATYNTNDYTMYYNSSATRFNAYTSKGSNVYAYYYRLDNDKDVYTLTLDFNYGTVEDETHRVLETATYTLTAPTRVGYAFLGWNTAADGSGTTYAAGGYTMPASNTTLYAVWGVSVTLGSNGYATFASSNALDLTALPTGLTAYKAAVSGSNVNFTELDQKVPANTGILLKGDASGEYDIPVAATSTTVEDNAFLVNTSGTTFAAESEYSYFGLKKNTLTFGLFDPATVAIPASKAYLKVLTSSLSSHELTVTFDGEENGGATGIKTLTTDVFDNKNAAYNLNGQRVNANHKGIVIVNGKKYLNK